MSHATQYLFIRLCLDSVSGAQERDSDDKGIQAVPQYVKRVIAVAGDSVEVRNLIPLVVMVQVSGIKNQYHGEIGTYTQC